MNKIGSVLTVLGGLAIVLGQNSVYRLPTSTYPVAYNIWLNTSLYSDGFNGEVEIKIGVNTVTNNIIVSSHDLQVKAVQLFKQGDGNSINIPITKYDYNNNMIRLQLDHYNNIPVLLEVGTEYVLKLEYSGIFRYSTVGIFKANPFFTKYPIIVTSFLPQYAHKAFPCYDEPQFKTPFTISIQHAINSQAVSNMKILEEKVMNEDGFTTTVFHTTPALSTHSIAFAITNFESICNENTVNICVFYDPVHVKQDVSLVLLVAESTLDELQKYLGVALDIQKLDIVPVNDVIYNGNGNYGLLVCDGDRFYYDPLMPNVVQKDLIVRHIIQQIVDIYFVNVITPEWWTDIWINNGISVMLEYVIADKLYPDIEAKGQFISAIYSPGYSQAIIKPEPDLDLLEIFNGKYKAAGVMNMFKNILGETIFVQGLKRLLTGANKLYTSETFFNAFQALAVESNKIPASSDLITIMNTWITQISFPICEVSRNYETGVLRLSQNDVLNNNHDTNLTTMWWVPYNFITQDDDKDKWTITAPSDWLSNLVIKEHDFSDTLQANKWVVLNRESSGFYLTNYDKQNWNLLATQLDTDHTKIPWITRTQLLHDSIFFAHNEKLSLDIMFKIANYLHKENDFAPLVQFLNKFINLDNYIYGTSVYANFTKYVLHKIEHLYDRVRLVDLSENRYLSRTDQQLSGFVIALSCYMGLPKCLTDTNTLLVKTFNDNGGFEKLLDHEFGYSIMCYGFVLADTDLFWKAIKFVTDRGNNIIYSYHNNFVGYVQNPILIDQLLVILTTQNGDKVNDMEITLSYYDRPDILRILSHYNLAALDKTLEMVATQSDAIKNLFDQDSIIYDISQRVTTDERLAKFIEITDLYEFDQKENYLSAARSKVDWANRRIPEFQATLGRLLDNINDIDEKEEGGAACIVISTFLMLKMLFVVKLFT